jgi:CRP/FNR family transcriptional regulator, cyclic AMP receptor protein
MSRRDVLVALLSRTELFGGLATDYLDACALYPMHVRLARCFLIAIGSQTPPRGKRLPLELGISQSEPALLLGASRPKINEALGTLEEAGAIGRTLAFFCDPTKLSEIANA